MIASVPGLALAATFSVTSCGDSPVGDTTSGTLRAEVTLANSAATSTSNDWVDLTACKNSTITLTQGAITVSATSLRIGAQTSGSGGATIHQQGLYRIFRHSGSGSLAIKYANIENGHFKALSNFEAYGGCIYSAGTVVLNHATVNNCIAESPESFANGGAVFARGDVTLRASVVSKSYAFSNEGSRGGGVDARGALHMIDSTVTGNRAGTANDGFASSGGGVFASSNTTIIGSTIDNNYVQGNGGGIVIFDNGTGGSVVISNSTISGNIAEYGEGAGYIKDNVGIYNSTVAFNRAGVFGAGQIGGLYIGSANSLTLQSSIFANNSDTSSTLAHDLYINYSSGETMSPTSSSNLIRSSNIATPGIVISSSDPLLTPLANHGGLTRTHALLAGSPAVDAGNNSQSLSVDQRENSFLRVVGANPDIGAYERQIDDDEIFYNGLESNVQQFPQSIVEIGTGFAQPTGVAVDSNGNVFVADRTNNAVKEILTSDGSTVTVGFGFNNPFSVAVDKNGNVFVADRGNNVIKEIEAVDGTIPASPAIRALGVSFNSPTGVAVDDAGNVFVADTGNNAIKELVAVNGSIPATPTVVLVSSSSSNPISVAVDHDDNVYVANGTNVTELFKASNYATNSAIGTGFTTPFGVWADIYENVFVADASTNNVSEISADHTTTTTIGGQFYIPYSVTTDIEGTVFVADTGNAVVKKIIKH